jgi:hypothetical protein
LTMSFGKRSAGLGAVRVSGGNHGSGTYNEPGR